MSARHSIEPNSISFKRGFAALHHALMRAVLGGEGAWISALRGSVSWITALRIARWDDAATMLRIAP
ncbi:hypothetical protein [Mesorhizobium sp.]|uniref:hypothetical protein n=1 Tax=Mesorhizobium sp. TaxID=1871066 RepID=UPI000FE36B45|nr:hypothetical protein [Mesorhizobium sp.]RWH71977.1 MAG: hypothetical protein EOQ84_13040 [Mesorhizobium sp.]RWL32985.1 MAG: hypothetical protein EOR58_03735 [Mesorhizobium sp.]RWL33992.1 MAG: hypothetical protein EOR63_08515 [Mesorhizobium sp.]RWL40085.1 MAG: hypothetical protein EOR59_06220 [Mesorhizobium sp.]RWL55460.1 MAG: hypothetical protein EOR61_12295 [Mesorhizobium sp.]